MKVEIGEVSLDLTDAQVESLRRQLGIVGVTEMLDAAAVAQRLGTTREFVYDHARELGGEKLGSGPKARWRFDPARLDAARVGVKPERATPPKRRPRRRTGRGVELLAVRGKAPYAPQNEKRPPAASEAPTGSLDTGGASPMSATHPSSEGVG